MCNVCIFFEQDWFHSTRNQRFNNVKEKNALINWAKSLSHQINPNQTEKEERD